MALGFGHGCDDSTGDDDAALAPCAAMSPGRDAPNHTKNNPPHPSLDDAEGAAVPAGLPPVIDAHVHLFAPRLFDAIWRWFGQHGWPIRYRLYAEDVIAFLRARGVRHMVALHYAHKPGIADGMNEFMADLAQRHEDVTGLATVCPGEPGAVAILRRAFGLGLRGVKLHCHVQSFAPDADHLHELYALCSEYEMPLVMHAGREPKSAAYKVDTHQICHVERTAAVLRSFPRLKLLVPHLGADEFDAYQRLLERYDNLWLDTTMMLADYFAATPPPTLLRVRPERVLYGTDFPNLPYAWDRELRRLAAYGVREQDTEQLLSGNACALFGLRAPTTAA
jgi:hypothetical protein